MTTVASGTALAVWAQEASAMHALLLKAAEWPAEKSYQGLDPGPQPRA